MQLTIRNADEPTIRLLDGLVLFWSALWLVVAVWTGYTIWQLSDLGDTVTTSGEAITSAGEALESVGAVPVIGEGPGELGAEVLAAGEEISARGQEVKSEMRQLAILLGVAIAVMPTTPIAGLYLPLRNARRREVAELRRSLERAGDAHGLDRYLAERAMQAMPFDQVVALVGDPWRAVEEGRARPLADAELARLGIDRTGTRV